MKFAIEEPDTHTGEREKDRETEKEGEREKERDRKCESSSRERVRVRVSQRLRLLTSDEDSVSLLRELEPLSGPTNDLQLQSDAHMVPASAVHVHAARQHIAHQSSDIAT
jgi:hypothetical protein